MNFSSIEITVVALFLYSYEKICKSAPDITHITMKVKVLISLERPVFHTLEMVNTGS